MSDKNHQQNDNSTASPVPHIPTPIPAPEKKPLDKVKPPTEKKRSREWER